MQIKLIIIFLAYQLLQIILIPLFLIYALMRKMKKKPIFGSIKERFGFIPKSKNGDNIIWIHAVSVGEILSIQNLVDQIKSNIPTSKVYITTGTTTGKNTAEKNLNYDYLSFLPLDFLPTMLLGFKRIKPKKIIIIEADVWPNFVILSKLFKIPAFLLNARINEKSKNKYFKLKFLFKPLFNVFKQIFTQSEKDKYLFEQLGIKKEKLQILGNIKALNVLVKRENISEYKKQIYYPTLLVGSVHPGELNNYLNLFKKLKANFKDLKLILAPRHFHWKKELVEKIKQVNCNFYLWEKDKNISLGEIEKNIFEQNNILLVCKLGELFRLYQLCDIFFLGGTFVPIGGHNLLEPAVWGKLSIIGPYDSNCKDIANKLEKNNGLIKTTSKTELLETTNNLLKNKELLSQYGNNAYSWLVHEASIVQNNLDILIKNLK